MCGLLVLCLPDVWLCLQGSTALVEGVTCVGSDERCFERHVLLACTPPHLAPHLPDVLLQGSTALVDAVTNVRVEVKLGLLSPDAHHVLMLYMALPEPSGAWQLRLRP
jgi:hypothetical protein